MTPIGDVIRAQREARALSILDVSRTSGLSPQTIGHIEKGRRSCRWVSVVKLCEALGLPIVVSGHAVTTT